MSYIREFIESGILEMYVLGITNTEEASEVERMAASHPEIKDEIESISIGVENYAMAHAVEPNPTIKPFVFAAINYTERIGSGEAVTFPPVLHEHSTKEHYAEWLSREDLQLTSEFKDYYARIIGYTPEAITAIAWLKDGSPYEVHHNELEKFLILEGTCEINIGDLVYPLTAGDYLGIPLHIGHSVKVTSEVPCKVILQRVMVA